MCNELKVKDYSVKLEDLSSDKLRKLSDIAKDSLIELRKEVHDTEYYIWQIKQILNLRGTKV